MNIESFRQNSSCGPRCIVDCVSQFANILDEIKQNMVNASGSNIYSNAQSVILCGNILVGLCITVQSWPQIE